VQSVKQSVISELDWATVTAGTVVMRWTDTDTDRPCLRYH